MRGVWLVIASIGVLVAAYAADRWLWHINMQIGTFGRAEGWHELALAVALAFRLVLLATLAALFVAMRQGTPRWASWAMIAIGGLVGIVPPLAVGIHIALAPGGLPFVMLNQETAPLWDGRGVFLLWTAVGLLMIGVVSLPAARRKAITPTLPPLVLAIGAALLFVASYAVDGMFRASAIELASGVDAYPAYMLVALGMRIGVMAALVVLLGSVLERRPSRMGGAALIALGVIGFAVLPIIGLQSFDRGGIGDGGSFALDPGTSGRWLAGAVLIAGAVELLRRPSEAPTLKGIAPHPAEVSGT